MSDVKRCDQCQREQTDTFRGWLRIERLSLAYRIDDDPRPLDFCSWSCVADYAAFRCGRVKLPLQVNAS